mgnify:CR=1 FL=1
MLTKEETQRFIDESQHAIEHIYEALNLYNTILVKAQKSVEDIKDTKKKLSDLFMYRDQWSPDANHLYALYMSRLESLTKREKRIHGKGFEERLSTELANINSSVASMSSLAGTILQLAKQVLSVRFEGPLTIPSARKIGSQSIVDIIWEGRNHSMHLLEAEPRPTD